MLQLSTQLSTLNAYWIELQGRQTKANTTRPQCKQSQRDTFVLRVVFSHTLTDPVVGLVTRVVVPSFFGKPAVRAVIELHTVLTPIVVRVTRSPVPGE